MRVGTIGALLAVMTSVVAACAARPEPIPSTDQALAKTVYVVGHGWHAGIVVRRADIPNGVWPEHNDFPEAEYLEFGWGDRRYYQTPDAHLGVALRAAVWPTASVLHIVGFSDPVRAYFPHSDIIEIALSPQGFDRLCRYAAASYARDETGNTIALGPGLYGDSRFYSSAETYHIFNTCNVWTAKALRAAGCSITPALTLTVGRLMARARNCGKVIRSKPVAR